MRRVDGDVYKFVELTFFFIAEKFVVFGKKYRFAVGVCKYVAVCRKQTCVVERDLYVYVLSVCRRMRMKNTHASEYRYYANYQQ